MDEKTRKILIAVDGSVYSNNAIAYLTSLFKGTSDISFHLFCVVSCTLPEAGREWMDELSLMSSLSPEARNRYSRANRFMKETAARMEHGGIPATQLTTKVQLSRLGVATDIIQEARSGLYDALVIGRRGVGKIEELFMGSVSATVLGKCHTIPIWIVDKKVQSDKILLPVDGSFNSLLAVDHLGYILRDNPHATITLFHSSAMLAIQDDMEAELCYRHWGKEWCDAYMSREDSLFEVPKQLLVRAGFPEKRIFWQHAFKGIEPARQIIRQALMEDFGTIVLGRRGEDSKRGLFYSVSDRVVFMADQVAIWIIG